MAVVAFDQLGEKTAGLTAPAPMFVSWTDRPRREGSGPPKRSTTRADARAVDNDFDGPQPDLSVPQYACLELLGRRSGLSNAGLCRRARDASAPERCAAGLFGRRAPNPSGDRAQEPSIAQPRFTLGVRRRLQSQSEHRLG